MGEEIMHLAFADVNHAFQDLVSAFNDPEWGETIKQPGRGGRVKSIIEPVTVTFMEPRSRVLFNEVRDANPFYHLYEALWMLAGRNDVESLAYFEPMVAQFSDNGKTMNGAYGYRWRIALGDHVKDWWVDQIEILVQHLKEHVFSKRAILQMWNVEEDLCRINEPNISRDVCCNLACKFRVIPKKCSECDGSGTMMYDSGGVNPDGSFIEVPGKCEECDGEGSVPYWLDMAVYNRANDLTWGMLGCNYVTLTILQEYMAARLGLELGNYRVMTTDLHYFYERDNAEDLLQWYKHENRTAWSRERYTYRKHPGFTTVNETPLITGNNTTDPEVNKAFMEELNELVTWAPNAHDKKCHFDYTEVLARSSFDFLSRVCFPMFYAFREHRRGHTQSGIIELKDHLSSSSKYGEDWLLAGVQYLERRQKKSKEN
jgi:thymidylate synthase